MSLTLKDLRVLFRHDDHPDDEVRGTLDYRPASLADLVEVLTQEGAGFTVTFDECCRNSDDVQMMTPHGDVISGNGECVEWVIPEGRYLVLPLEDTP